jgi:non-specific serine/threonine protein kinase/serine/threonine-protein kinase
MIVDAQRWTRLKSIFHDIVDLAPEERRLALEAECGDDAELRQELESLLRADDHVSQFINVPAQLPSVVPLPKSVGPYRVVSVISHGGMGTVYLAQREEVFEQQVAIKVIRAGLNADHVVKRFHLERQILARLEHPNICRLLDGGTTADGLPYLVMEYVDGIPIDQYCDAHGLSTTDRVRLCLPVLSAVQAAQQHLIVHRDIKQSNILVTRDGIPKLLDFGIAKLLDDSAEPAQTATEYRALTPEYASPEHVSGTPLTTVSDIYSFGVVLYELLTGQRPYQFSTRSPAEIARVVAQTDPQRPSTIIPRGDGRMRRLRGDLDNIVLMALRKDPGRRYSSAEAMAEDLKRHLDGRPVLARADTLGYRTGKFMSRNRVAVTAAVLLLAVLVGGIVATSRQARIARDERDRAERRFNDVRKLANALVFDLHDEISLIPSSTVVRQKLVRHALTYLESLSQETTDPDLQIELARAYDKIGESQGNPYVTNLGQTSESLNSYRTACHILERVLSTHPEKAAVALPAIARAYRGLADVMWQSGDIEGAHRTYLKAAAAWGRLSRVRPLNADEIRSLCYVFSRLGDVLGNPGYSSLGRTEEGLAQHVRALNMRLALRKDTASELEKDIFDSYSKIALFENALGRFASAAKHSSLAVETIERWAATQPDSRDDLKHETAYAYMVAAQPLRAIGRNTEAEAMLTKSIAVMSGLSERDPASAHYKRSLSILHNHLTLVRIDLGDIEGAMEAGRRAVALARPLSRPRTETGMDLAIACSRAAEAHLIGGDLRFASRYASEAITIFESFKEDDSPTRARERAIVGAIAGRSLAGQGDLRSGAAQIRDSIAILRKLADTTKDNLMLRYDLMQTTLQLGQVVAAASEEEACQAFADVVATGTVIEKAGALRWAGMRDLAEARKRMTSCGRMGSGKIAGERTSRLGK